jgi:acetyl esterase/lipase
MSIDTHKPLIAAVANSCHCRVLGVNYGLAPEDPFPQGLNDVLAAYSWLIEHHKVHPESITLMGDSAGGGLAFAALLAMRDQGFPLPGKLVAFSPWVDLECPKESWKRNELTDYLPWDPSNITPLTYANGHSLKDPLISPVNGSYHDIPTRVLIQSGTVEVLHDEALRLTQTLVKDGVEVKLECIPQMPHAMHFLPYTPWSKGVMSSLIEFMHD